MRPPLGGQGGEADLPLPTVQRHVLQDGAVVPIIDGEDGSALDVGRRQRTVPAALKRALLARDRTCTYPGCHHERYLDAHHVRHWADGGETSLDNMLLVCDTHHRLIHEGCFTIERHRDGCFYFARPDGRPVENSRIEEERPAYLVQVHSAEFPFSGMAMPMQPASNQRHPDFQSATFLMPSDARSCDQAN